MVRSSKSTFRKIAHMVRSSVPVPKTNYFGLKLKPTETNGFQPMFTQFLNWVKSQFLNLIGKACNKYIYGKKYYLNKLITSEYCIVFSPSTDQPFFFYFYKRVVFYLFVFIFIFMNQLVIGLLKLLNILNFVFRVLILFLIWFSEVLV